MKSPEEIYIETKEPISKQDIKKLKEDLESKKSLVDVSQNLSIYLDKYGIDAIVGLIPGLGDGTLGIVTTCIHLYIAQKIGVSTRGKAKILAAQSIDATIGTIPVFGDIFDIFWRANKMSYDIIQETFEKQLIEAKEKLSPEEYKKLSTSVYSMLDMLAHKIGKALHPITKKLP